MRGAFFVKCDGMTYCQNLIDESSVFTQNWKINSYISFLFCVLWSFLLYFSLEDGWLLYFSCEGKLMKN